MDDKMISCDACGQLFSINSVKVRSEALTNERTGMYFKCPHCKTKYPFASLTEKGKKLRKKLARLVKKIGEEQIAEQKGKLILQHQALLEEYQHEVTGPYLEEEVVTA